MIDQTLEHIHGGLIRHPAFRARGGPDRGSSSFDADRARLDRYGRILENCARELKNSENLLYAQALAARRVPREMRYLVNQSLHARQSNFEHVHQKADAPLGLLQGMIGNFTMPDVGSLDDLFKNAEETLQTLIR